MSIEIKRNKQGVAIIDVHNKITGVKITETLVDDNVYHELIHFNWYLNDQGYVEMEYENHKIRMDSYIFFKGQKNIKKSLPLKLVCKSCN